MKLDSSTTAMGVLLDERIRRRQVTRMIHGHLSPTLWRDPMRDPGEVMDHRRRVGSDIPKTVNLYVGTPYCLPTNPDRCGFCLFPSEEYKGSHQLDEYLHYLEIEGELFKRHFEQDKVESIYFGGGTSNLYKASGYRRLMDIVRGVFPSIGPDVEITLEGIPQTYTLEKLSAMRDAGINRISVGVQQFDDELIKFSGRKQKRVHTMKVLQWCHDLGLRPSVDLIYGWPTQTNENMLNDLQIAVESGVPHITHYELNVGGRTDFAQNHADTLPSIAQNLEMYRAAYEYMTSQGYVHVSTYDWRKPEGTLHFEEVGAAVYELDEAARLCGHDTWGWGFAGVSNFLGTPREPGWIYMNCERVQPYIDALKAGTFPISKAHRCSTQDLKLIALFQSLISTKIDRVLHSRLFAADPFDEHRDLWEALAVRGWAEITPEAIQLIGDGVFFTPTIQGLVAEDRVREVQRSMARSRLLQLPVVDT